MKKIVLIVAVTVACLGTHTAVACFDTYSFLRQHSMVYPKGLLAIEGNSEFVAQELDQADEDLFSGNLNAYYGIADQFSVQASVISAEKPRHEYKADEWAVRGVYGVFKHGRYSLDGILEHHVAMRGGEQVLELSAPSIFNFDRLTVVFHPVLAMGNEMATGARGHGGIFYALGNSILGVGAEYESAQSSANIGRRLVKGEAGTSLFLGSAVSRNLYWQNELIKGWGADGKDIGFAATLKILLPTK
ncbi:MAG: hypothetical protein IPG71_10410 [bacterium]|nr:hypothetical protein [bacterium]